MDSITHIQQFVDLLSKSAKEDYTRIIKNFDFAKIDFYQFENWQSSCYTRNCFYRDPNFELILICWDKGTRTAIHDHDGEECWVYLLDGQMEEEFYNLSNNDELELLSSKSLKAKQLTKSSRSVGFHRLKNSSLTRSMSLHIYAKPIVKSRFLDEESGIIKEKKLTYNTFKPFDSKVEAN